jgi:23S rRNA (cytosine1962-C5)-methyltransferase
VSLPTLALPDRLAGALRARHPWIYRDALPPHELEPGAWVRVEAGGEGAIGLFDAEGAIAIRLFSWQGVPDEAWWEATLARALASRAPLREAGHTCYRLLHGEGDFVPGLVADRYGRFAVLQPHAASLERFLAPVARRLRRALRLKGVVVRRAGGLETLVGEPPPPEETVVEHGLRFLANLREGQKTGLFLDHREHRQAVRAHATGRRVLNLFAYAGGFSVYALAGGAREAWSVDVAEPALRDAERNVALNELPAERHRAVRADVFAALPRWAEADERFEMVVLDPPSLARRKRRRARAEAAYRRLNAGAARLVAPGGLLASASCTAQVGPQAFEEAVRAGLAEAGRSGEVALRGGQPLDHPTRPGFPEGRYLKFLLLRLDPS